MLLVYIYQIPHIPQHSRGGWPIIYDFSARPWESKEALLRGPQKSKNKPVLASFLMPKAVKDPVDIIRTICRKAESALIGAAAGIRVLTSHWLVQGI